MRFLNSLNPSMSVTYSNAFSTSCMAFCMHARASLIDIHLAYQLTKANMNRITRVGLLSLIAIVQVLTIVGGFIAYEQMSETMSRLEWDYKELYKETHGVHIDYGLTPNPFAPLFPLVLSGLFLTAVLLIDQVRHRNAENINIRENSNLKTSFD